MSRKTINVIIGIVLAFIVVFFAGSFAYEQFIKDTSDRYYDSTLDDDISQKEEDNKQGDTANDANNGN